jgi:hypothetical protein
MVAASDCPAIAAQLTHGRSLRWEAAVVATLLDLAARGHLQLVMEPAGLLCHVPRSSPPAVGLAAFERMLLDHVWGRLAVDGAPIRALVPDYKDEDGHRVFESLDSAMLEEAHRRGLVRDRRRRPAITGGRVRTTAAGDAAVKRWLEMRRDLLAAPQPPRLPEPGESIADGTLAWAVALDAAPGALAAMLPAGAWSSLGGSWRQVRVRKGNRLKGTAPRWSLGRSRADERRTFTGRVIRRWTESSYADYVGTYTIHFLAVDDGVAIEAHVWTVDATRFGRFPYGSDVRVTIDHKQRLVEMQ